MEKYHKIQTVYLRDPANKYKTLLEGQFALPEFEYLANNEWLFSEKIDGTNIRIHWDCERAWFVGRTDRAKIPAPLLIKLHALFPAEKFRKLYPETPMNLYGEGYGVKIQKGGGYIPDDVNFILFDVKIDNWLDRENVLDIAVHLDLDMVPLVGKGTLAHAVTMAERGFESHVGKRQAEGLVMRPAVELVSRTGKRIITKVKTKDFQRKEKR